MATTMNLNHSAIGSVDLLTEKVELIIDKQTNKVPDIQIGNASDSNSLIFDMKIINRSIMIQGVICADTFNSSADDYLNTLESFIYKTSGEVFTFTWRTRSYTVSMARLQVTDTFDGDYTLLNDDDVVVFTYQLRLDIGDNL